MYFGQFSQQLNYDYRDLFVYLSLSVEHLPNYFKLL